MELIEGRVCRDWGPISEKRCEVKAPAGTGKAENYESHVTSLFFVWPLSSSPGCWDDLMTET